MSDLFARIGPKASTSDDFRSTAKKPVKLFPNKTWVREGYQAKRKRWLGNTNRHDGISGEDDSDSSSRSHDGHNRDDEVSWEPHVSSIHRPLSPGVPSLLVRMGLSPGIKVEEVSQTVPKESPAGNIPSPSFPRSFMITPKPKSTTQASKSTSPVQPEKSFAGRVEHNGKGLERTGENNNEIVPSSLSSVANGHNQPNVITTLKTNSPHGNEFDKGQGHTNQQDVASKGTPRVDNQHKNPQHDIIKVATAKLPTPPPYTPPSDISSANALRVATPTNLPRLSQSSNPDAESRSECSRDTKSRLGRIIEQNATRRVSEQSSSTQLQPTLNPSTVLTGDFCDSMAKSMNQAQKEIDEILASPQVQSLLQQAMADQQAFHAASIHPDTLNLSSHQTSNMIPPQTSGQSRQVFNYTPSPSPPRVEGTRSPVHLPRELLAPQGPSQQYNSGHPRYMDNASPTRSGDRASSVEYNDDRYYSRPEPYPPTRGRSRGWGRGRGDFRAPGGWRGRGRGRENAPYDNGYGHRRDRSDDYYRHRSFSPRRTVSPPPKRSSGMRGHDDDFGRSRSRSRSKSPGKGKGRYRSPSRGRSKSPRKSRSPSPLPRAKSYRSKHDYEKNSSHPRRPSDYSRSHKYSKRSSRSLSRSIASSRSRSRSAERHQKNKKHRLRDKSRSVSPNDDKYSSKKKRKYTTPSPEERRKRRHSSVSRRRDRTPSLDRKRADKTGGSRSEASMRVYQESVGEQSRVVQKSDPIPPQARSADRTPKVTSEPTPATATEPEVIRPLPCHNVPGLWSARLGNAGISTFQCTFEIDELTAQKWDIAKPRNVNDPRRPAVLPKQRLGVQICCYLKEEIESLMQGLQPGISPQEVANKISGLKQEWPSTLDLVITIHPKLPGKKTWLSFEIGPGMDIAPYIHQGENIVEFVQLSDMSKNMFVILSAENDLRP